MVSKILEWVGGIAIGLSALQMAIDQAIKNSKAATDAKVAFVSTDWWNYAPLTLILLGVLSLGIRALIRRDPAPPTWDPRTTKVIGKHFTNERVVLDGQHLQDCVFTNVTFIYNGTAAYEITNCKFTAGTMCSLDSDNMGLRAYAALMLNIRDQPISAKVLHVDKNRFTGAIVVKSDLTPPTRPPNGSPKKGKRKG